MIAATGALSALTTSTGTYYCADHPSGETYVEITCSALLHLETAHARLAPPLLADALHSRPQWIDLTVWAPVVAARRRHAVLSP